MESHALTQRFDSNEGARCARTPAGRTVVEPRLCGCSESMRALRRCIRRIAPAECSVLLAGETGVGKGVAARSLHAESKRARGPFVHVDCSALSPSLIESELFGHERGAFTGAVATHKGCFERAAGGTLFLDEIGELSPTLQAKLLRVLEDREYERVGGQRSLALRARIVAATNRDVARERSQGRFRDDLYYRLAVVALRLPPLRERAEDIPILIEEGCRRLEAIYRSPVPRPSLRGVRVFSRHAWPGNVRELLNALERFALLGRDEGERALLGGELLGGELLGSPAAIVGESGASDGARLLRALRECEGNVAAAARRLGMPRSTLRRRLRAADTEVAVGPAPTGAVPGPGDSRSGRAASQLSFDFARES